MSMGTLRRLAITTPLELVRRPADLVLSFVPGSEGLRVGLDRIDAAARGAAGWLFSDDVLIEDADRRRAATVQRGRAAELRTEAERRRQAAEQELQSGSQQAQKVRETANKKADERRTEAEEQRKREEQRAKSAAAARKREAKKLESEVLEQIETTEKVDRLRVLEAEAEAIDLTEDALRTEEEAERLKDAAARAKAGRKQP